MAHFLPPLQGPEGPLHHLDSPRLAVFPSDGATKGPSCGNTVSNHALFTNQLGELSKKLVFSEDALAALCSVPALSSYEAALQNSRHLFAHQTVGVPIHRSRRAFRVGRHSTRGPGSRHLPCHLTAQSEQGMTDQLSRTVPNAVTGTAYRSPCPPSSGAGQVVGPKTFTEQMASGAKPLHLVQGSESTILLNNNAMFKKVLQPRYPPQPSTLSQEDEDSKHAVAMRTTSRRPLAFIQGQKRWLDFPQPIEPSADMPWECLSISSSTHLPSLHAMSDHSSCTTEQHPKQEFFNIMKEWRLRWQLHIRPKDVSEDSALLQEMCSVHDRSRMIAIAAISVVTENEALLAMQQQADKPGRALMVEPILTPWKLRKVSSVLVRGLERLLEDKVMYVRVPSAVTLYCMDKQNEASEEVLLSALSDIGQQRSVSERWAAVQCLVCAGVACEATVREALAHLLNSREPQHHARAAQLLTMQSSKTSLVHSMLADQLNNSGWQERLAACNVLPLLHKSINKDLCTKLLALTWDDWSPEVQHAAAKALGCTSHAKMIHDDIVIRLTSASMIVRLDAIRKLHTLKLMTSKLLPSFLTCFNDKHLSIRMEAVAVSGSLKLTHPLVLQALKQQLHDKCWMLKMVTLQALAEIGHCDDELIEMLIWGVRFEKMPMVRVEACRTIGALGLREDKVMQALKDLVTVDDEQGVVEQAVDTLAQLGYTDAVRDVMMDEVCDAVQKLGTKATITAAVVAGDSSALIQYGMHRPTQQLATRDYLDDKQRYLLYGGGRKPGDTSHGKTGESSDWTPDTQTINGLLDKMKKRVRSRTM